MDELTTDELKREYAEEIELSAELAKRISDVLNSFGAEYRGRILQPHLTHAQIATLLSTCSLFEFTLRDVTDLCKHMMSRYVELDLENAHKNMPANDGANKLF